MARGSSIRPKNKPEMARIVIDSADSTRDKFMSLERAAELFNDGKLRMIDLGPSYPNSYAPKT